MASTKAASIPTPVRSGVRRSTAAGGGSSSGVVLATMMRPLLEGYDEAVTRSRKAGRPVSLRVSVDRSGGATVVSVDEVEAPAVPPIEEEGSSSPELEGALAAARERGQLLAAEILSGPDMVSGADLARMLGTTRVTVNAKRQAGQLLGLDGAKRGFRFPVWQLDGEGRPYPEIVGLHERLGEPWAVYRFLVRAHGSLGGLTGRQALERGRGTAVLRAAEGIAGGDFS